MLDISCELLRQYRRHRPRLRPEVNRVATTSSSISKIRSRSRQLPRLRTFSPFHFHRVFKLLMGETSTSSYGDFASNARWSCGRTIQIDRSPRSRSRAASHHRPTSHAASSTATAFRRVSSTSSVRTQRRGEVEAMAGDPRQRYQLKRLPEGENPDGFKVQLPRTSRAHGRLHSRSGSVSPGHC